MPDPRPPGQLRAASALRRQLSAFGRFWWEFLVGDTPELALGAVVVVVIVAVLVHHGAARAVTVTCLPVLVVGLLGASVRRAQHAGRRPRPPGP